MKGIYYKFKFSNDNMEELDTYLGVELSKM